MNYSFATARTTIVTQIRAKATFAFATGMFAEVKGAVRDGMDKGVVDEKTTAIRIQERDTFTTHGLLGDNLV